MNKLNKDYGELMKNKKGENEGEFEVALDKLLSQVKKLRREIEIKKQNGFKKTGIGKKRDNKCKHIVKNV